MGSLGPLEIGLIFLVILLVFGAKRIPEIARGLGKGIREFKDATTDIKRELTVDDTPRIQHPQYPGAARHATPPAQQPQPQPAPPPAQDTPPAQPVSADNPSGNASVQ
jgi:sec-independent protein translocase protein TatA